MNSFSDWLKKKNEAFGGSAGDPSNAGLDQPESRDRKVSVDPGISLNGNDSPITRRNKLSFAKKKCNCK